MLTLPPAAGGTDSHLKESGDRSFLEMDDEHPKLLSVGGELLQVHVWRNNDQCKKNEEDWHR